MGGEGGSNPLDLLRVFGTNYSENDKSILHFSKVNADPFRFQNLRSRFEKENYLEVEQETLCKGIERISRKYEHRARKAAYDQFKRKHERRSTKMHGGRGREGGRERSRGAEHDAHVQYARR